MVRVRRVTPVLWRGWLQTSSIFFSCDGCLALEGVPPDVWGRPLVWRMVAQELFFSIACVFFFRAPASNVFFF